VIHFHHVVHGREEQSTPGTASALPLEQVGPARNKLWVAAQSACPVQEVAIIDAGISANLDVSHDGHLVVEAQPRISATPEHQSPTVFSVPVSPGNPMSGLARMTASHPAPQLTAEPVIHPAKHFL
jgi:hypothetical protein